MPFDDEVEQDQLDGANGELNDRQDAVDVGWALEECLRENIIYC